MTTIAPPNPRISTPELHEGLPVHSGAPEKLTPTPIANIMEWAKGKIEKLLKPERPSTPGVVQKVMDMVNKWGPKIMNMFSGSSEEKKSEPQKPSTETQPAGISTLPKEVQKAYNDAEEYHRKQLTIMENSFVNLSQAVSPGITRDPTGTSDPENLSNLALQRIKALRSGKFDHDETHRKEHGNYGENISKVYAGSGKEVLQDFMDSRVHRGNVLGKHTRLGVAIDGPILDKESGEYMYFVVALYKGGETVPENDKDGKPIELNPLPIPDDTGPAPADDITSKYFNALAEQIKASGSTVKHGDDIEGNKTLSEVEKKRGSFRVVFSNDSGKIVRYLVSKNPPTLTREENGKNVSVLFPDVLVDFAKAPDERAKPESTEPVPTPAPTASQTPESNPANLQSREALKQQVMEAMAAKKKQVENPNTGDIINPS